MLTFVASCIQWVLSSAIVVGSDSGASKFNKMNALAKKRYSTSKQKDSFLNTEPLLEVKDGKDMKANKIRVKVKMTKEEAARLLSKCNDGGFLEFRDVARELVVLPVNRVNIVSTSPGSNAVLYNIAEEYSL